MKVMGRMSCGLLAAIALVAMPSTATANINLELRPAVQVATVGQTVDLGLFVVSDDLTTQFTNLVWVKFSWNTLLLQLTGLDQTGATPLLNSHFPLADPFGNINGGVSPPVNSPGFYEAQAFLGPANNVPATPLGTLLTTFKFTALGLTPLTTVSIIPGANPSEPSRVFGPVPNSNVTGTLGSAAITIIPEPSGFALLLLGAVMSQVRRRRR